MDKSQLAQFREIIGALLAQTRAGKVEWEQQELFGNLTTTLANGQISLSLDRDQDTVISIYDTYGNVLETINAGYIQYKELKADADKLYELARRSALEIDSKLESILREITA